MAQLKDLLVLGPSRFIGDVFANNLQAFRVTDNFIPIENNTYDLGSSSLKWNNIYGKNLYIDSIYPRLGINAAPNNSYNLFVNGPSLFGGDILIEGYLKLGTSTQSAIPSNSGIRVHDLRNATILPKNFGDYNVQFYFNDGTADTGRNGWSSIMHIKGWQGDYAAHQLSFNANNSVTDGNLYHRTGITSWEAWRTIADTANTNWLAWTTGTTAGPKANINFAGVTKTSAEIPTASQTASGVVTTGTQNFQGRKRFGNITFRGYGDNGAANRYPGDIYLESNAGVRVGEYWYDIGDATNITKGQFFWREYSPNSTNNTATTNYFETYNLPNVTTGLTENKSYAILTTKSLITIAQGGTGASSAAGARANLEVLRYINTTDMTTWTAQKLSETDSIAFTRGNVTGAYTTGHMVWLNARTIGTPFQLVVHDSSDLYMYKRWYASGVWSAWQKMKAGLADSATTVYSTVTVPSNRHYLEFQESPGANSSGNAALRHHNSLSVSSNVSTSNSGTQWTELWIGNATASGTAGNSQGWIALYTSGSNYTQITTTGTGHNNYFYIPNYDGNGYAVTAAGTEAVGSNTNPIYIAANGRATAITYTANRLYYSASANSFNPTNHYANTTKIGVNITSEPSYNFQVSGTSYFNGLTTHNGNTIPQTSRGYNLGDSSHYWIPWMAPGGRSHISNLWLDSYSGSDWETLDSGNRGMTIWNHYWGAQGNKMYATSPDAVTIEHTTNNGSTWTVTGLTNLCTKVRRRNLTSGGTQIPISAAATVFDAGAGNEQTYSVGYGVRITFDLSLENRTFYANQFLTYLRCYASTFSFTLERYSIKNNAWTTVQNVTGLTNVDQYRTITLATTLYCEGSRQDRTNASHFNKLRLTLMCTAKAAAGTANLRYMPSIGYFCAYGPHGTNLTSNLSWQNTGESAAHIYPYSERWAWQMARYNSPISIVDSGRFTGAARIGVGDLYVGDDLSMEEANVEKWTYLILGNGANVNAKNTHSQGRIRIYSAATQYHDILGTSTTTAYYHYFPNSTGWIATGGNGSNTGVGDTTQPIYLNSAGILTAIPYTLNATVNSGTTNRMAYYSGASAISSASNVSVLNNYQISNSRNGATVDVRANGIRIWGQTYGNTANQMLANTTGVFRFGDGGPQIQFNTSDSMNAQAGALIFTDHDTAGTGTSFHFVTTESSDNNGGNLTVTAPRFRARKGLTVGQNSDNSTYPLYVVGRAAISGMIFVNNTAGTGEGGIALYGTSVVNNHPEYGMSFTKTSVLGTFGDVTSDWATYFHMDGAETRGWIFQRASNTNVASISARGLFTGSLVPGNWLDGHRYKRAAYNIADYSNTGSYNPWMQGTNTWAAGAEDAKTGRWFGFGTLGTRFYWIGSKTTRTSNGYDNEFYFDIDTGILSPPKAWIRGPLQIGSGDAAASTGYGIPNAGINNYIAFYGVNGDGAGSFNHSYIGERIYQDKSLTAGELSELLIYHGNDVGALNDAVNYNGSAVTGPDRIRMLAHQFQVDVTTAALSGTWDAIGTSTNREAGFVVNRTSGIVLGNPTARNGGLNQITVNGHMVINGSANTSNSYSEGLRINKSSNGWAIIALGGETNSISGTSANIWLIGTTGGTLYIRRNASSGTSAPGINGETNGFSVWNRLYVNTAIDTNYNFQVTGSSYFSNTITGDIMSAWHILGGRPANTTNFRTHFETVANLHHDNPARTDAEISYNRWFCSNSDQTNYSPAKLNLPVIDQHVLSFGIDNGVAYSRHVAFDIKTNNVFVGGRVNNTWQTWDKILTDANADEILNKVITVKTGDSNQQYISDATLINWLITKGYIPNKKYCHVTLNCSWSYTGNDILRVSSGGYNFEIQLAGCIIEYKGYVADTYNSSSSVYRLIIHTSPTRSFTLTSGYYAAPVSSTWEYFNNGSGYSPTWRCTSQIPTISEGYSSQGWGNSTGTGVVHWNDSTGGSVEFRRDNPSSGKMSIKVDGRFYGNEGANPAMLMTNANGYWGMGDPDANATVWIRTTSTGIIPYQSGGVMEGHQSLGTSSWYFANSYITRMYTHQLTVQGTIPSATMNAGEDHPRITFQEGTETQPVHLMYSDWDSYRAPAGLKIVGGTSATPAWLEVEGNIYIGNSANNGGPHLYLKNNTITKGTNPSGWKYSAIEFQDNAASRTSLIENGIDASGNNWLNVWVTAYTSGSTNWSGIRLHKTTGNILSIYLQGNTYMTDANGRLIGPHGVYTATAANRYASSALEIRENGLVGNAQSVIGYAPTIGWHWSGRIAATTAFHSDGRFYFIKQNGVDRAEIDANIRGYLEGSTFYDDRDQTAARWYKFCVVKMTGNYQDAWIKFDVSSGEDAKRCGRLVARFRTNATWTDAANATPELYWEDIGENVDVNNFVFTLDGSGNGQLWCCCPARWTGWHFIVVNRGTSRDNARQDRQIDVAEASRTLYWHLQPSAKNNGPANYTNLGRVITSVPNCTIRDINSHNQKITFAYSMAGLAGSAISWLACWNGYQLRAISKAETFNAVRDNGGDSHWVKKTGDTMTGDLNFKSSSADSPDITWWYGDTNKEQARIWMGSGGTTKFAPNYRCYNSSGTQLYNGYLVLGDGTGASGTWGISISGNSNTAKYLMNRGDSTVSIGDSGWGLQITPTGETNRATVWHQKWTQSGLTYTPSGGSATTVTDSGDIKFWLSSSNTSNALKLNIQIDGSFYAATRIQAGNIYSSDIRGGKLRLIDNWLGFYSANDAGGSRYGYIQANENRMYFRKENGVSTWAFDFNGAIYTNNEFVSGSANGLRIAYGNYGTIFRNDGSNTYILLTASGQATTGSWNSLRPFRIHNENGKVYIGNGAEIANSLSVTSGNFSVPAGNIWAGTNGDTAAERNVGVQSGAGVMYMYSQASASGNRGIYIPAHGTGSAKSVFVIDTNNNVTFYGSLSGTATNSNYLNLYEARGSTTNLNKTAGYVGAGKMFHLVATSSTTTGKTSFDANILQMNWDNTAGYDSQLGISTTGSRMQIRSQAHAGTAWREVVTTAAATQVGSASVPVYISNTGQVISCTASSVFSAMSWTGGTLSITVAGQDRTAAVPEPASGAWYGTASKFVLVHTNGVMEIGKYIDFHYSNSSTADYDFRFTCDSNNNLIASGNLTVNGNLVVASTGTLILSSKSSTTVGAIWIA